MNKVQNLIREVSSARKAYLNQIKIFQKYRHNGNLSRKYGV